MNKNVYWSSCKVPVISCQILKNLGFLKILCKKSPNIKFQENPSMGAELFHEDGRTDRHTDITVKFNSRFYQFLQTFLNKTSSQAVPIRAVQSRSVPSRLVAFLQQPDRSAESMCLALLLPHWLGYGPPASERGVTAVSFCPQY